MVAISFFSIHFRIIDQETTAMVHRANLSPDDEGQRYYQNFDEAVQEEAAQQLKSRPDLLLNTAGMPAQNNIYENEAFVVR